jgi:hypothetical protein
MIPHTLMRSDRVTIIAVGRFNPDAPLIWAALSDSLLSVGMFYNSTIGVSLIRPI